MLRNVYVEKRTVRISKFNMFSISRYTIFTLKQTLIHGKEREGEEGKKCLRRKFHFYNWNR